jgi:phosphoglycolate phosphatase
MNRIEVRHIVYDWDGTLCDSIPRALQAMAYVFAQAGRPAPTIRSVILTMTHNILQFYRDHKVELPDAEIIRLYFAHAVHEANELYSDVRQALTAQRDNDLKISLVTAQRKPIIDGLFDRLQCGALFDAVVSGVHTEKGLAFAEACRQLGLEPGRSLCVGDIRTDVEQARLAGLVPVWINRHGADDLEPELRAAGARHVVKDLHDLNVALFSATPVFA